VRVERFRSNSVAWDTSSLYSPASGLDVQREVVEQALAGRHVVLVELVEEPGLGVQAIVGGAPSSAPPRPRR